MNKAHNAQHKIVPRCSTKHNKLPPRVPLQSKHSKALGGLVRAEASSALPLLRNPTHFRGQVYHRLGSRKRAPLKTCIPLADTTHASLWKSAPCSHTSSANKREHHCYHSTLDRNKRGPPQLIERACEKPLISQDGARKQAGWMETHPSTGGKPCHCQRHTCACPLSVWLSGCLSRRSDRPSARQGLHACGQEQVTRRRCRGRHSPSAYR